MAKYIFIIACAFLNLKSIAQFGPQRIIATEVDGPLWRAFITCLFMGAFVILFTRF